MPEESVREREATPLALTQYRPSTLRYLLFHKRVLRVGWGLLLFAGLFWLLTIGQSLILVRLGRFPHNNGGAVRQPRELVLSQLIALISVFVATVVPSLFEQRRLGQYGFDAAFGARLFGGGLLSGLLVASALIFSLRSFGYLALTHPFAFNLPRVLRDGVIWIAVYAGLALMLTMLTRGYPQYTLTRGFAYIYRTFFLARSGVAPAFWTAALLLSAVSALLQVVNARETPIGLVWIGAMSSLFCLSLWRTGSLWWAIGFQAAWDWTQSFLFGVPDSGMLTRDHLMLGSALGPELRSGGATGPEGSIFTAGAFVVMLGLVLLLKKRPLYPDLWLIAEEDHRLAQLRKVQDPDLAP